MSLLKVTVKGKPGTQTQACLLSLCTQTLKWISCCTLLRKDVKLLYCKCRIWGTQGMYDVELSCRKGKL